MRESRISWSVLLPILNAAICVAVVAVPATLTFVGLEQRAARSDFAQIYTGRFDATIPRAHFLSFALNSGLIATSNVISAANLPGILGEILISLPTSWPSSWHPQGLLLDTWRSLTFPIFCSPAWWLVGRGIDTLWRGRRLHWIALLTGSVLFVLFAVLFFGLEIETSSSDRGNSIILLWGLGLWAGLFALLPIAWFRQWRLQASRPTRIPV